MNNSEILNLKFNSFPIKNLHSPKKHKHKSKYERILIVDDSSYNLFVLEELLNDFHGVTQIEKAINGQEAIEKFL
jgi:PleD family two-component response regulator